MAMHNIDWHQRIGARRKELADYLVAMREDTVLGELVDLDRLQAMLSNWSSPGSDSREAMLAGWFSLTSAVLAGQFVGAVSGRNDL